MGTFFNDPPKRVAAGPNGAPSVELLHRLECRACPLNHADVHSPKMEPTGQKHPDIYVLGEAPGKTEDERGRQFVGDSGRVLRQRLPEDAIDRIRWNNVIRTRPPGNRDPSPVEIECCRPSIVRDIERTKPKAIFGFGNVPLNWALGLNGINMWRGRKVPIMVGTHACWFYPFHHPSYIMRKRRFEPRGNDFGSEDERMFAMDIERAISELDDLPEPEIHTKEKALEYTRLYFTGRPGEAGDSDIAQIRATLKNLKKQKALGFDLETNMLRPYNRDAKILSFSLSAKDGTCIGVALRHREAKWEPRHLHEIENLWIDFLLTYKGKIIVHNSAFEQEWMIVFYGRKLARGVRWQDTMTQAWVLDERKQKAKFGPLSLEFLCLMHFGINIKQIHDVDRKNMDGVPIDEVLPYNNVDAKYHIALYYKQLKRLKAEKLMSVYHLMNRRVTTVVLTQIKGVPVEQGEADKLLKIYKRKIEKLETRINNNEDVKRYKKKFGTFNPSSTDDVQRFFVDFLKLKLVGKDEKEGSTDSVALDKLKSKHVMAKLIPRYRTATKMKATYVDAMRKSHPKTYIFDDGLMHPILNTLVAETGRLSSEFPNEQNYPKHGKDKIVRKPVRPRSKNGMIVAVDFGQLEARVTAMATLDKTLIKSLWDFGAEDIHMTWGRKIAERYPRLVGGKAGLSDKAAMGEMRQKAKNKWVFPAIFGCQPTALVNHIKAPLEIVEPLFEEFWDYFPGIRAWQKKTLKFYNENGYVELLTGRRRRGPLTPNQIYNTPIQGPAADIVLDAMNRLSEYEKWRLQPNMNVHDDLTFIYHKADFVESDLDIIIAEMLKMPFEFMKVVPMELEVSIGDDWYDMQPVYKCNSEGMFW